MFNTVLKERYKSRTYIKGLSETQRRMYKLFFKYPSELEDFVYKLTNNVLPERSLSQMTYYKIVYNLAILKKLRPEVVVYSYLAGKGEVPDEILMEKSGLDKKTFDRAMEKLRSMGRVE